jgi:hypothetical protein
MRRVFSARCFCVLYFAVTAIAMRGQMAPKTNREGDATSIVRNDSTSAVAIEFRSNSQWQPVTLEPGKDATIAGDRIRVATTRQDKAIITVDLPISAGKKYRLVFNAQLSMWDFSAVQ